MSSLYVRLALRPSICFLHFPPTCIDKFSWTLKFDIASFNAFFFTKVLYKNSLLKCSWRAYYAPFMVLRYIYLCRDYIFYMYLLSPRTFTLDIIILYSLNCQRDATWTFQKCKPETCSILKYTNRTGDPDPTDFDLPFKNWLAN